MRIMSGQVRLALLHGLPLLVLLSSSSGLALDPERAITQYTHNAWTQRDGMPQNSAEAIVQTHDGYLWFGTQEGLVRFDGVRFAVFDKTNTDAIKHNGIVSLCEGPDGSLWIATFGGGLVRLQSGQWSSYTTAQGLPSDRLKALCLGNDGRLWIGTRDHGLCWMENERFHVVPGMEDDFTTALCQDAAGDLWIGTDHGLQRLHGSDITKFDASDGLPGNHVSAIAPARRGGLWLACDGGLARFDEDLQESYTAADGLSESNLTSVLEDKDGCVWVGTNTHGLNRLYEEQIVHYPPTEQHVDGGIWSLYEDREGSLWIGTSGGGLHRLNDGSFTAFTVREGLASNQVQVIYEDSKQRLWISTEQGLNVIAGNRVLTYTTREGLAHNNAMAICEDRSGDIWIGTYGGGLSRFHDGRFTTYTTAEGLPHNVVRAICQDHRGDLWFGTNRGLARLRDGRFTSYTTEDGLANDMVRVILEDDQGALWLGTDGGLCVLADGLFTSYTVADGLASNIVISASQDRNGDIWLGTYGGGLTRCHVGRFRSYTVKDGLYDDAVFRILEDDRGHLWMSCNKGIFRVSKEDLAAFDAGRVDRITSVSYGLADGMPSMECNGGSHPAGWRTHDGRLWFPTVLGAVSFDPERIQKNEIPPPVLVEQALFDRTPVDLAGKGTLPYGHGELQFRYTALSFLMPLELKFKYKLEGFDADWVDAGTRRTAYYTNIPPGRYTFQVKACNSDGVWNEAGAMFAFFLKPPFTRTPEFYALTGLALAGIVLGSILLRINQMKRREQTLVSMVEERTRQLREAQQGLVENAHKAGMADVAAGVLHNVGNILTSVNTSAGTICETLSSENLERMARANDLLAELTDTRPGIGADRGQVEKLGGFYRKLHEAFRAENQGLKLEAERLREKIDLINDVIKAQQSFAGSSGLFQAYDLVDLVEEALTIHAAAFNRHNIKVSRRFQTVPPVVVQRVKMVHVLVNLFKNAKESIVKGGRGEGVLTVVIDRDGRSATIRVTDTGVGIKPEHLSKIFNQGFTTKDGGHGFGLHSSANYMIEMGGRLAVEIPEDGTGATFTLNLPLDRKGAAGVAETAGDAISCAPDLELELRP